MKARPTEPAEADPRVHWSGDKGAEYLFRRREFLALEDAREDVRQVLGDELESDWKEPEPVVPLEEHFLRYELRQDDDDPVKVTETVRRLQGRIGGTGRVALNSVFSAAVAPPPDQVPEPGEFLAEPQPRFHNAGPPEPCPEPAGLPRPLGTGPGRGAIVGIVDTGIVAGHPWLDGRRQWAIPSDKYRDEVEEPSDDPVAFHGTFIGGLILRTAPGVETHFVRAMSGKGFVNDVELAQAIERLLEKTDNRLDVLNLSLGGYTMKDAGPPIALLSKLRKLSAKGTVVVAAAGNSSREDPFWPAFYKDVRGVGSLGRDGNRAEFSNYGYWVDACATGENLVSSFASVDSKDPYVRWTGTSFSSAVVTGAIAAKQTEFNCSAPEAAQRLFDDARPSSQNAPAGFPLASRVVPQWEAETL